MILVTGKPGVGKTTLLKKMPFKNIFFMDCIIKNQMYVKPHLLFQEVVCSFGKQIVEKDKINTQKLGEIILSDPKKIEVLNALVVKHVKTFLKTLPKQAIVEFGTYVSQAKNYQNVFDKAILIENQSPNLKQKFTYLKTKPIFETNKIKVDYQIDVDFNNVQTSKNKLKKIIENILKN